MGTRAARQNLIQARLRISRDTQRACALADAAEDDAAAVALAITRSDGERCAAERDEEGHQRQALAPQELEQTSRQEHEGRHGAIVQAGAGSRQRAHAAFTRGDRANHPGRLNGSRLTFLVGKSTLIFRPGK